MKNSPDSQSRADDDLRTKVSGLLLVAMLLAWMEMVAIGAENDRRIPIIDVTDLYHPRQDVGDNFDLIAAYGLAELDLRAVIFDCSAPFRQPEAVDPGPGLATDKGGPREPGFIPVLQLNYIFNRNIPCATAPFAMMKSPTDEMRDAPGFQQQGLELLLQVLRDSKERVHVLSFGSSEGASLLIHSAR